MSLAERIAQDMKGALKGQDHSRLSTLRMLRAAIQRKEVDERITLDDDQVLGVIQKLVKQGQDAISQFEKGARADLVAKESKDLEVLKSYLPKPLADAELDALIDEAIQQAQASSVRDMGKVMGILKSRAQGRADMSALSSKVKTRLQPT
ncbi:MAG: GatB/YqeY domain-containing protein [Gammaproteobacteria bacterium]|nr:GatB/YqeY domain-containing protein [Gammaproteobacteria bacterium]